MDLDATQALDLDEYDETEEEQEDKKSRKQVGQLKVFRTEDFEQKIYDIFEGENVIGRDEGTDVYIPRKSLSKTHACIEVSEDLHLVYDDNSKNRTRRDKMILKPQVRYELHHGDMLTLADIKCQYFKGKIEQDNDDDDTGSETGSESMLPLGLPIPSNKDAGKEEDTFAANTDSETDDEKNPVNIKKPVVYSSDEKLAKQDVVECSDQPKPKVPAFMYDSSDDDNDDEHHLSTKPSTDIKAHMDVSADSGTLAFGLVSPDDVPIIRPTSKKMCEVENTPLTLVYSPDTQDRTPDNVSILPKGKKESSSCAPTLIYGSESPYQEKSPVKEKQGPSKLPSTKTNSTDLSGDEPGTPNKMHVKNIPEPQREVASCAETLPVQEIESLKETPVKDVEPTVLHGVDKLQETPLTNIPKVDETPSEFNVYLPETQGFSPGNEEASFCEPTQAYLQESPVDTPKETPEEMVSDVTSIPDSQEESGEEEKEKQNISELKKVLSFDDSATQAYAWNDSDATDDEDDELQFQATQAYPSHIQQLDEKDKETKDENVATKDKDVIEQGADVQDISPCVSPTSHHTDMQQTIAYDVTEMDTQAYNTEKDELSIDNAKDKDQPVPIEPTLPYNIMDMETQAYEAEAEEATSPASDRLDKETPEEVHKQPALIVGDSRGVEIEPTLPYDLEEETQDFGNNKKDVQNASEQMSKKNADDTPVIEATMPYDIDMETQAYDRKDVQDTGADDEDSPEKKKSNMADMMETQAYGEVEAEENDVNTGPSNTNDDAYGETQAYGLEDQGASPATDDVVPDSEDVLSQEIPLKRIIQEDDTINNNVPDKTPTHHDKQQIDESCNKEEEEAEIIIRPKRRGKGRVTHSSPEEENQQPTMLPKVRSTRGNKKSNKMEAGVQDTAVDDSEEDQFKTATKTEKRTRERRSTRGKTLKKSKADVTEEEQLASVLEKRATKGRRSKKGEVEPARVQDVLLHDTEEEPESASKTEKRPTAKGRTKKTEVEIGVQGVPLDDTEEGQQELASKTEKRPTGRGRTKKTEVEIGVQGVSPDDTMEGQQELASTTEKRPTARGRIKKTEVEIGVQGVSPDDTIEGQQELASKTEKKSTRGRRSKESQVDIKVQEEQQESASVLEKRPTRGRLKKTGILPGNNEGEVQESASISEKKPRRRRMRKTEVDPPIVSVLPDANEKDRLSFEPIPSETEDLPESLRERRSGKEVEKEEKSAVDNTGDKNKPDSAPEDRQEKMSTRGTRSRKKYEEGVRTENAQSGDNDEHLGTSAANVDINVPEHTSSSRPREKKREVIAKVEDMPPRDSEEEEFAVKQKGKGKGAVSLQFDQDSSGIDEELPSMEVIFSGKKTAKGKTKGQTKDEETPAMLPSKDSSTVETVRDEEKSSETVEVKPFFPRRGRGRVTQSDDSASAIPGTSGSELLEFKQDLMSPQSVAKSISTRKEKKRIKEDQTQKETGMDRSASQSNTPSPSGSKTRKRGKEAVTESTATKLNESQGSVTSSVGRKGRGKGRGSKTKATDADESHVPSASQASDLSESQSSTASSVESKARGKGRRRTGKPSALDDTQEPEAQETPAKKGRTVKREDSPTMVHSPSLRGRKQVTPKIMFTGVSDKQAEKVVTSLGGILVDSVYECTHLITDKVRRTVKFLCGVASGQMILQPQWLTACKKAKNFIDPVPFIVSDKAAEKQYSFSLQQSLEKAQQGGLLEGYKVHITKNVKPDPSQMKDIIKSAKGEYLPRMPRTMENNVLVVSSEEDQELCKPALACGLPVYSSELLLTGILRQELELDQNRLFFVGEEGNRKRKESEEGDTSVKSASRKRRKK